MKSYTVSQINNYIKNTFDNDILLGNVLIEGEISNFKYHSSGHLYFNIKDEESSLSAVMFARSAVGLKFMPEDGMKVLAGGRVSVYEKQGKYQLYCDTLSPKGKGDLYFAFEQLKLKLEKAGVFDQRYKKPIPRFPKCVAVVTSATGAAVRDIINVISRRDPTVEIVVVPTLVQGSEAAKDIARSIELVNLWGGADTIIVGRGGGSIEDLWAFNEEPVARAIFDSTIPIISAVGHETDFTIADFTSDLRAPTPSAAAELAVPESNATGRSLESLFVKLNAKMNAMLDGYTHRLGGAVRSRAVLGFEAELNEKSRLIEHLTEKMNASVERSITLGRHKVDMLSERIDALSPLKIMGRGYSMVYRDDKLIRSADELKSGDELTLKLCDGEARVSVTEVKNGKEDI